jgi:hypothetical protein
MHGPIKCSDWDLHRSLSVTKNQYYMCIYICVYIYTYIYKYIYKYTYIHLYTQFEISIESIVTDQSAHDTPLITRSASLSLGDEEPALRVIAGDIYLHI